MNIPIVNIAVVTSPRGDSISLNTEWGLRFNANLDPDTAMDFALKAFPTAEITILDMYQPNPQVEYLQHKS